MTLVNVDFTPARMNDSGANDAPVLGQGTVEVFDAGLRFRGRRTRTTLATVLSVAIGVVGAIAAATLLATFDFDYNQKRLALFAGLAMGVLPGLMAHRLLHKYIRGPYVDVMVPWSALRVLTAETNRATLRLVAPELRGDVTIEATDSASSQALWMLLQRG